MTAVTVSTVHRRATKQNPVSVAAATLFMVIFTGYFLAPIWWLVVSASKPRSELTTATGLWFGDSFVLPQNVAETLTFDDANRKF